MGSSESQQYILGRELENKWGQTWERNLNAEKGSLGLDIVLLKLIDAFDLIAIEAKKDRPIIIDGSDDSKDHIWEIEMYRFEREEIERLENEDPELILEHMINSELINDAYISTETDPQKIINRLNKRLENITAISNRAGLSSREKTHLGKTQNDIKDDIERERNRLKKQLPVKKKLRPNQQDKNSVQKVAKTLWHQDGLKIGIKEMENRDDILNAGGKHYTPRTRHKWLSEVAPSWAKKPGRRKES